MIGAGRQVSCYPVIEIQQVYKLSVELYEDHNHIKVWSGYKHAYQMGWTLVLYSKRVSQTLWSLGTGTTETGMTS